MSLVRLPFTHLWGSLSKAALHTGLSETDWLVYVGYRDPSGEQGETKEVRGRLDKNVCFCYSFSFPSSYIVPHPVWLNSKLTLIPVLCLHYPISRDTTYNSTYSECNVRQKNSHTYGAFLTYHCCVSSYSVIVTVLSHINHAVMIYYCSHFSDEKTKIQKSKSDWLGQGEAQASREWWYLELNLLFRVNYNVCLSIASLR